VQEVLEQDGDGATMKKELMLSLREVANEPELVRADKADVVPLSLSAAWGAKGSLNASAAWGGKAPFEAKPRLWESSTLRANSPSWNGSTTHKM
jgi:hypothetical protein